MLIDKGKVTVVEKLDTANKQNISYLEALEFIRSGIVDINGKKLDVRNSIENIRLLYKASVKYDKEKKSLPHICWNGTYNEKRTGSNWDSVSQLIYIDLDFKPQSKEKVTYGSEDVDKSHAYVETYFKKIIRQYESELVAVWRSSSLSGLGLLFKYESNEYSASNHIKAFNDVRTIFKNDFNIEIDRACRDISRINFCSYDPDMFISNLSFEQIKPITKIINIGKSSGKKQSSTNTLFNNNEEEGLIKALCRNDDKLYHAVATLIESGKKCRSKNYDIFNNEALKNCLLGYIKELTVESIKLIKNAKIDITTRRDDWAFTLFTLLQLFDDQEALSYFHDLSMFYPDYDYQETCNFFEIEKDKDHHCFNSYIIEAAVAAGLKSSNLRLYHNFGVVKNLLEQQKLDEKFNLKGEFKWLRSDFFFDLAIMEVILDSGEVIELPLLIKKFEDERLSMVFNYAISDKDAERFIAKKTKEDKAIIIEADTETKLWDTSTRSRNFLSFMKRKYEEFIDIIRTSGLVLSKNQETLIKGINIELSEGGIGIRQKVDNFMFDRKIMNYDAFDNVPKSMIPMEDVLVDMRNTDNNRSIEFSDYIQNTLNVKFNPENKCPNFDALLEFMFSTVVKNSDGTETTIVNHDIIDFFWKVVGCSLAGHSDIKKMLYVFGPSNTGKSTLFNILRYILGDLACMIPTEALQIGNSEKQRYISRLKNKRFCYIPELPDNRKLDQAFLKGLTGGDPISYRELFKEPGKDFTPNCLFFFTSNHILKLDSSDEAFSKRLCPLKIARPIRDFVPPNGTLESFSISDVTEFFLQEASGIVNRCIDGYQKVMRENKGVLMDSDIPKAILEERELFVRESDIVAMFFSEVYTIAEDKKTSVKNRYDMRQVYQVHFDTWCKLEGINEKTGYKNFRKKIRDFGSGHIIEVGKKMCLEGLTLKQEYKGI